MTADKKLYLYFLMNVLTETELEEVILMELKDRTVDYYGWIKL